MTLSPGFRIGQYDVLAKLGAGGMGEVYRARDTKLGREVALKILPEAFASDPDRLMRFEREARTLASLNHPHIAQVYGIEDSGSTRALVMELVAGEDLSARIARGPISIDEALPIARQIAEALEAAHEAGIIHRDLKPANIKVRDDGTVKVLDFGLAKALDPPAGGPEGPPLRTLGEAHTITSPAMTMRGVILGTAAYMAPEQAKGKPVDRRADIWAFGCVLYEVLTGTRAFKGDDITDTLTAVLRDEPDWTALPADTPASVRTLLDRCLKKDPRARAPHAAVARLDIDDALRGTPPPGAGAPVKGRPAGIRRTGLAAAVGLLAAIALGATASWVARPTPSAALPTEFLILPTRSSPSARTDGGNMSQGARVAEAMALDGRVLGSIAVSPDGRSLVFESGGGPLWVRGLDSIDERPIPGTDGATFPFWSPDGRWVAFFGDGKLRRVAAGGGPVQIVADAASGRGGSWGPGDVVVFAPDSAGPLHRVDAGGGVSRPVTTIEEADPKDRTHRFPWLLPDARHFLYTRSVGAGGNGLSELMVGDLQGGQAKRLAAGANAVFAAGAVLYQRDGAIVAHPFDVNSLEFTGDPVPLVRDVQSTNRGDHLFSATDTVLVRAWSARPEALTWISRDGRLLQAATPPMAVVWAAVSPDGRQAALTVPKRNRDEKEVWLLDLVRGTSAPLATDGWNYGKATWSADGKRLLVPMRKTAGGPVFFVEQEARIGGGARELVEAPAGALDTLVLQGADGTLIFSATDDANRVGLRGLRLDGDRTAFVIAPIASGLTLTPDGRWLAYIEQGRLMVTDVPGFSRRVPIPSENANWPHWTRGGREIVFRQGVRFMAVSWDPATGTPGEPTALLSHGLRPFSTGFTPPLSRFDVHPDGSRILLPIVAPHAVPDSYVVTLNWSSHLRRR